MSVNDSISRSFISYPACATAWHDLLFLN